MFKCWLPWLYTLMFCLELKLMFMAVRYFDKPLCNGGLWCPKVSKMYWKLARSWYTSKCLTSTVLFLDELVSDLFINTILIIAGPKRSRSTPGFSIFIRSFVRSFGASEWATYVRLLRSNFGPYTFIKGQRDKGIKGQMDKGTKGQRDKGAKGQRDKGTKGNRVKGTREKGTKGQWDNGTMGQLDNWTMGQCV